MKVVASRLPFLPLMHTRTYRTCEDEPKQLTQKFISQTKTGKRVKHSTPSILVVQSERKIIILPKGLNFLMKISFSCKYSKRHNRIVEWSNFKIKADIKTVRSIHTQKIIDLTK